MNEFISILSIVFPSRYFKQSNSSGNTMDNIAMNHDDDDDTTKHGLRTAHCTTHDHPRPHTTYPPTAPKETSPTPHSSPRNANSSIGTRPPSPTNSCARQRSVPRSRSRNSQNVTDITDIMEQSQSNIDKHPSEWGKKTEQRKNVPVLPRARFVVLVAPASSWSLGPSSRPPCCAHTAFLGGRWYSYWHCRRCRRR